MFGDVGEAESASDRDLRFGRAAIFDCLSSGTGDGEVSCVEGVLQIVLRESGSADISGTDDE